MSFTVYLTVKLHRLFNCNFTFIYNSGVSIIDCQLGWKKEVLFNAVEGKSAPAQGKCAFGKQTKSILQRSV